MKRGTIVIALFIVVALGIFGANYFFNSQPPIEITIAADPLIEDWLREQVTAFNNSTARTSSGRTVRIALDFQNDHQVWSERIWSSSSHPDGWIPALSTSVEYANNAGSQFEIVAESVARTPLMLGGFSSRVDALTSADGRNFDWQGLTEAAEIASWGQLGGNPNWQFDLAFTLPDQTATGLGSLLSAAANLENTDTVSIDVISSETFRNRMAPVVGAVSNYNSIGADVSVFMARTSSTASIGMATESQWLNSLNALLRKEDVTLMYPAYTVIFDFPLAMWDDVDTQEDTRQAVTAFGDWLLQDEQQASLNDFGLRSADGTVAENADLFVDAEAYGIQSNAEFDNIVNYPTRTSDIDALLNWFQSALR